MLIDCCASGNMFRWLQPQRALRHSYVCFMSTVPYTEAGAAWTMTSSWINCITCSDGSLPLSRVIDFLSDETARIKGDLLIVYLSKSVKITSCAWLPQRASHKSIKKLKWRRLKNHIPSGAKVTGRWSSGDRVYYKHPGGPCQLQQEYIPPVWLPATINSITQERRLHLQVIDPVSQLKWNIEVSKKELLNDLYMASTNMVPENFFKAQCKLATHFNFFDYSLTPATAVNALGEDGKTYDAMVVDWRVVDWKKYLASGSCNDSHPHGPYVALYWLHSKTASILPLCRIVDHSFGRSDSLTAPDGNSLVTIRPEDAQRKVFLKSIESCGKTVVSAADVLGTSKLSCFWPEDGEWYDAEALDPSSVSLEVLATHVMFTVSGKYCPAYYEDGTIYLTPLHYVRKRKSCPFSLSWLCSIER